MSDAVFSVLSEHGPWVILVFYLLYRDVEKDRATRLRLDMNTAILVELSTIIRERLPAMGG
ncbi:MAG: hypothetical protein AAGA71_12205 [Pseudomonadota bacterium]